MNDIKQTATPIAQNDTAIGTTDSTSMSDANNETGSTFARDRATGTTGGTNSLGAATATAAATERDYGLYKTGRLFTKWFGERLLQTPEVALNQGGHMLVVVELRDDGQLNCRERGTEIKHIVPLDEHALDTILPQVLKS